MRKLRGTRWAAVTACCAMLAVASGCSSANAGEPAAARAAGVSRADRAWIDKAHQANMAETQAGELAQSNGSNPTIRQMGAVMARDHQRLDSKLISVAERLKLKLPTSLTLQQTEIGDRLSGEQGPPFDHDFIASMMTAHDAMIAATRQEIAHGSSPKVVALATQALPVLLKHLRMLRSAAPVG
jgi:putative membrane protein